MEFNIKNELIKFLHLVQKPARYIGGEYNIVVKENPFVRVAISYPDLYDVGMSNNGIRILYEAANRIDGVACERVFAVDTDMERELRKRNIPLWTLESFTAINKLDMIGFNLAHELLLTNLLQILDLGNVPLLRNDRRDGDPIVIAGGEFTSNPFPARDFVDLFFIGEGEEGFPEIIKTIMECKSKGMSRIETIKEIGKIDGVLVSMDYDFSYEGLGVNIQDFKKVKKRSISCNSSLIIESPIVPLIRISQERCVVELSRGCFNLCKFCHAGYYNMPYRVFSVNKIADEIYKQIDNTGYDEVTLTALSASDYKYLVRLLNSILPSLTERGVSLSLPSLKVDKNTLPIIETISSVRKSSLTFAVESASEEIRSISNKKVKTEDLLDIVSFVFKNGWKVIKLYFMIGLPGCEDIDEGESIVSLLKDIAKIGNRKEINVTVSPFVPKPHTPFQYERQMSMEYFYNTIKKIKQNAPRQASIKNHDVRSSFLEGLIARSDDRMGKVILSAYCNGARLDSWHEHFNFDIWMKSIEENLPNWREYLENRDNSMYYPWNIIETGNEKAIEVMQGKKLDIANYKHPENRYAEPLNVESYKKAMAKFEEKYKTEQVLRFIFSKTGDGRYIPHIDFIENVKRAFRMVNLPMSYSQGFNKREKLSAGFPVPLGIESLSEIVDVELYKKLNHDEIQTVVDMVNERLSFLIRLIRVRETADKKTIMANTFAVGYFVKSNDAELLKLTAQKIEQGGTVVKNSKSGQKEFLVNDIVHSYFLSENTLQLIMFAGKESSMRVDEFLSAITLCSDIFERGVSITKTCQYKDNMGELEIID